MKTKTHVVVSLFNTICHVMTYMGVSSGIPISFGKVTRYILGVFHNRNPSNLDSDLDSLDKLDL